jgi:hypothetical protein
MIKKNTVFVLGAGASCDFGYPTGEQLKQKVIEILLNSRIKKVFEEGYGIRPGMSELIGSFVQDLKKDQSSTIDRFLLKNPPDYKNFGRAAIAQAIMECEEESLLFRLDKNWYYEIYKIIDSSHPNLLKLNQNKLKIVTFNYDRSLEHYLYRKFIGDYGAQRENEIIQQLNQIPIIHIHGKVNSLPWQEGQRRRYQKGGFIPEIFDLAKDIKLPGDNPNDVDRAKVIIQDAEKIYFIGFGYDEQNLQQLDLNLFTPDKHIFGTCLGFSVVRQGIVKDLFSRTTIELYPQNTNAFDFIMNHFNPNE